MALGYLSATLFAFYQTIINESMSRILPNPLYLFREDR